MPTYGVTSAGFVAKDLATIESEVDAGLRAILGESAGTEPDGSIPLAGFAGQLKSLLVDFIAAQWDLQEAVYASRDPNMASGAAQDAVCSITGTERQAAQKSTVDVVCTGDVNTILPAGRVLKVEDTGSRFTGEAGTIAAATAWAGTTAYVLNDIRTNANRIYVCITAGTSAGSGGPTTTSTDITDGTVHWKYLGEGLGYVELEFEAEEDGEIGALAGTLNEIDTPVSGWRNAYNLLDAAVGRLEETDAELRARREAEIATPGNTTRDAIIANIMSVNEGSDDPDHEPPVACKVFINDTDYTDGQGVPPHSIEVLVQGGTDADIAQEIWDSIGAGTRTYGSTASTVTDSEGNSQTVYWTRPTEVEIYVTGTARYDAAEWPTGSDDLVVQAVLSALLTYTEGFLIGVDVRAGALMAAMLRGESETDDDGNAVVPASDGSDPVPGLLEIDPLYIGTSPGPTASTQIEITGRQIAVFDSSRCTITATTETP